MGTYDELVAALGSANQYAPKRKTSALADENGLTPSQMIQLQRMERDDQQNAFDNQFRMQEFGLNQNINRARNFDNVYGGELARALRGAQQQNIQNSPWMIGAQASQALAADDYGSPLANILAKGLGSFGNSFSQTMAFNGARERNSGLVEALKNARKTGDVSGLEAYPQLQDLVVEGQLRDELLSANNDREMQKELGKSRLALEMDKIKGGWDVENRMAIDKNRIGLEAEAKKEKEPMLSVGTPLADNSKAKTNFNFGNTESLLEKEQRIARSLVAAGYTPSQAAQSARGQIEADQKAGIGMLKNMELQRSKAEALNQIGQETLAAIEGAGYTGTGGSLASQLARVGSALGLEDQTRKLENEAILRTTIPEAVRAFRVEGTGAMSDFESGVLFSSMPSVDKTREENKAIAEKYIAAASKAREYNDFIDAYRQQTGTVEGAQGLWQEYSMKYPLFKSVGGKFMPNPDRPSWKQYFQGEGMALDQPMQQPLGGSQMGQSFGIQADTPQTQVQGIPEGAQDTGRTKNGKPVYIVNGKYFIPD